MRRLVLAVVCASDPSPNARLITIIVETFNKQLRAIIVPPEENEAGFWPKKSEEELSYQSQDGYGSILVGVFNGKEVTFDRVIRVIVFDTRSEVDGRDQDGPIDFLKFHEGNVAVRLDTAAFARYLLSDGTTEDNAITGFAVSRLILTCKQKQTVLEGENPLAIDLNGFELVAHVPLAVGTNGTQNAPVANTIEAQRRLFDPRAIITFSAKNTTQSPIFPNGSIGPRFSKVQLALTADTVSGLDSRTLLKVDLKALSNSSNRLSIAATGQGNSPFLAGYAPGKMVLSDWLSCFANQSTTTRELGFRSFTAAPAETLKLGLRAEHHLEPKNTQVASAVNCLLRPALGESFAATLESSWTGQKILISQEQLDANVAYDLGGQKRTSWLAAVRFGLAEYGDFSKTCCELLANSGLAIRNSLRTARFASGITTLPTSQANLINPVPWHVVGMIRENPHRRRILASELVGNPDLAACDPERVIEMKSFQPRISDNLWEAAEGDPILPSALKLSLDSFLDEEGHRLLPENSGFNIRPPSIDERSAPLFQPDLDKSGLLLIFNLDGKQPIGAFQIGSLKFQNGDSESSHPWRLDVELKGIEPPRDQLPPEPMAWRSSPFRGTVTARIPVTKFEFVDQDDLPSQLVRGDERRSLVLPLGDSQSGKYELITTESFGGATDQDVQIALNRVERPGGVALGQRLLVVDPGLFRITEVNTRLASPPSDSPTDEIARFEASEDGQLAWRFIDPDPELRLRLPPQTIGESMEKRRATSDWPVDDIAKDGFADFRLGSPTILNVDPTLRSGRTFEAPVNIRRLFNRVGDAEPGPVLRNLRFEMAYGLIAGLNGDGAIRITEIGGMAGRPPQPLQIDTTNNVDGARILVKYANTIIAAQSNRLAVDRLWSGEPKAHFETSTGVWFRLRTAGYGKADRSVEFQLPVRGEPDPDLLPTFTAEMVPVKNNPDRETAKGFAGGIPWAFESLNILREAYARPKSDVGKLSGLHLSALGGWGFQRAIFANGKSVIETETDMGRLSHYKLERLGRIGALHNRAKHVIVYRRTVVPSAQFFNRDIRIGRKQDDHAGRPILRKVEEYIEILQPERAYPEDGIALKEAGCLAGSRFVSTKILVDSSWGGDSGQDGWVVPLWREDLASSGDDTGPDSVAALYPKPVIAILQHGQGGSVIAKEVENPFVLKFFTSTRKEDSGDNIDDWAGIIGVDYCDRPAPQAGAPASTRLTDGALSDAMLAGPPRVPAGYQATTLLLKDDGLASRLAAGRRDEGPSVVLRSITINRAAPKAAPSQPPDGYAPDFEKSAFLAAQLNKLGSDARTEMDALLGAIPARFEKIVRGISLTDIQDLEAKAIKAVDEAAAVLIVELTRIQTGLASTIDGLKVQLERQTEAATIAEAIVAPLRDRVSGVLDSAAKQLGDLLKAVQVECQSECLALEAQLAPKQKEFADLADREVVNDVDLGKRITEPEKTRLLQGLDEALAFVDKAASAALTQLDLARGRAEIGIKLPIESGQELLERFRLENLNPVSTGFAESRQYISDVEAKLGSWKPLISTKDQILADMAQLQETALNIVALISKNERKLEEALKARVDVPQSVRELIGRLGNAIVSKASTAIGAATEDLKKFVGALETSPIGEADIIKLREKAAGLLAGVKSLIEESSKNLFGIVDAFDRIGVIYGAETASLERDYIEFVEQLANAINKDILSERDSIKAEIGKLKTEIESVSPNLTSVRNSCKGIADWLDAYLVGVGNARAQIRERIASKITEVDTKLVSLNVEDKSLKLRWIGLGEEAKVELAGLTGLLIPTVVSVQTKLNDAITGFETAGTTIENSIRALSEKTKTTIKEIASNAESNVQKFAADIRYELENRYGNIARSIGSGIADVLSDASGLVDEGLTAADRARGVHQRADNVLRLIRAVGDPPKTDGLDFNRPEVAYVLDATKDIIDITPGLAFVNRAKDTAQAAQQAGAAAQALLESLGLRLPVTGILEDYVPASLKDLSVARLFPKMAGLDLEGLLKKAGFPDLGSAGDAKGIRITRGFDKEAREAWLSAQVDVAFDNSAEIFEFGPVGLHLDKGRFRAFARLARQQDGTINQTGGGRIDGDWRLMTAGVEVITFERTPLTFDKSGRVDFQISTDRVRMAPTLRFLTDLMASYKASLPPWLEVVEAAGVPVGVRSKIEAGPISLSAGAFSISNLGISAGFGLVVAPKFEINTAFDLAKPDAPFALRVWVMTGGGYVRQRLRYLPTERPGGLIQYSLEIAISAGVGIDFNFGVVSGGVYLCVGCSVTLYQDNAGGNSTAITAFVLAHGHVDVAGLASANISLRLAITYDGAVMIARGTLRLSFRISMFYTLNVNQGTQYRIMGKEREQTGGNFSDQYG